MTKEELLELKNKISNLNEKELNERDDYLRKIALGEIHGPQTGYPSIDKPWLKYYESTYERPIISKTVYQELHDNNLDQPKTTALEFFGSKISFGKLDKEESSASKSLEEYGVKKGKFVTIIAAGIPETVYSFFGGAKIGAVANLMSPYFDEKGMIDRINDCESELLLVMDKFYPMIKDAIKKSNIKNVVVIPTLNSSILRFLQKKSELDSTFEISWNQFIKDGKLRKETETVGYEKDMPLAMVYSSGTTGASKGILLSNDSFQNSVYAYRKSGVEVGRGFKFYQLIPPWYSTGLNTSIYLPLVSGSTVFMDPRFERDVFVKNVIKHKPNYSVAATSMYEGFLDEDLVKNKDLSFFKYPFEGGEPLRKEVADKIEKVFSSHGNNSRLMVGYGQCECGATITSETTRTEHVDGTVGIPLPGINMKIVDENYEELKYGERGEVLIDTPCGMLEYFKNEQATDKYFKRDKNTRWSCTGDIGHIDENGNLFIEGRTSDYSIINGKKVFNFDVENAILKNKNVKLCDVIMNNNLLTAHIVFNENFISDANSDDINKELKMIQELIYEDLRDYDFVPINFKIRESFPYAKSGKRDVQAMKNETDGFITLDFCDKAKVLKLKK